MMKGLMRWGVKHLPAVLYRPCLWWWVNWSKVYRHMQTRRLKAHVALPSMQTPIQVLGEMKKLTWTADGPKELWDACGSPLWPQRCLDVISRGGEQPEGALDCDDFSAWAAAVVDPKYRPKLISFVWVNKVGKISGHVMCLCQEGGKLFHIGNWGKCGPYPNLRALCEDILSREKAQAGIGWCVLSPDLKVRSWGVGLPDFPNKPLSGK